MATTTSYGSITIVDITDIGEFSVYPKCNLPTTVIYSPDSGVSGTYTPDWETNNLLITPVAYYAGSSVNSNITWTWTRQEGSTGTPTNISASNGESVNSSGVLTVSQNQFAEGATYSQLTYIVTATYDDSSIGKQLTAEGQITFSKVEQGTSAKIARINGENIIKYDGEGAIISPLDSNQKSYITLTGTVTQCSITGWKYKNGNSWTTYPAKSNASPATYPSGQTGATINIYADDTTFSNDKVQIKLETNDANTYDEFTIYKLRDGAAGTSTLTAILTNEDQMIPANSSGVPINIAQSGATSQIKIYRGGTEVTQSENWSISAASSDTTLTFSSSTIEQTNDTVTVTAMGSSLQSGNIIFTATHGTEQVSKTFSLVKVKAGADAETFYIYNLELDTIALNRSADTNPTYTPASFTATSKITTISTSSATTESWNGKFRITEYYPSSVTTNNPKVIYTTSTTENSKTYSPSSSTVTKILVELLDTAGSNVLDSQTVIITDDGATGQQGEQGEPGADAVSVLLGNEAQVFPCNNSNYPLSAITVSIPYGAYKGTTRVAATVNTVQLLGISPHSDSHAATTSSDGLLKYIIPTSTLITNSNGTLALTFTCESQTYNKVFSWTRSSAAKDGVDGVTMLIYTPDGTVFENGEGTVTAEGYLQSGVTDVTSSATWKWYQYNSDSTASDKYEELPTSAGTTANPNYAYYSGKTVTVLANAIEGYGSFKVTAVYSGKTYTQYLSLIDKSDPIQVSVHSTVGTQIKNGQGAGAIYARVTRSGEEIDAIGDTEITVGTELPDSGTAGAHFILLNNTNKTATLYVYDTDWEEQTIEAVYEWTFRDKDNIPITNSTTLSSRFGSAYNSSTGKVEGKCVFLNANTVSNKITADVKVTV